VEAHNTGNGAKKAPPRGTGIKTADGGRLRSSEAVREKGKAQETKRRHAEIDGAKRKGGGQPESNK